MATKYVNKVIYAGKTLVDMTCNADNAKYMVAGYQFQLNTGQTVKGTFLYNCPASFTFTEGIKDSNYELILDSDGGAIRCTANYYRS